jgi:demethoxyubiquinone hydroxylase (CLK1/Coq7/Cat5 family)
MTESSSRHRLVNILRLAYSGELAAVYAYRGHWRSVKDPEERRRIKEIEDEEWHHRELVGGMLRDLGERPNAWRELKARVIGRTLGVLCHVTGWLAPMYGAGRLESRNIREYEVAARYAEDSGHPEFVDCLLEMAEVEWEHESYFRSKVLEHRLGRRFPIWQAPPPKESIRSSFASRRAATEGLSTSSGPSRS